MHPAGEAPGTSPSAGGTPLIVIRDVPQMFWDASSDLLIVADHEGVLTATNPAWRNATGWVVSDSAEVRVIDLLHPNERAAAGPALAALTPGRRFEDLELRLRTIDDDYLTVSWSGFTDGTYWYIDGRDVTEQRQGAEEARAQSSLFSQLEIAVVNVGADLRITGWSVGAEQLYGWTKAEALNQQVTELIDPRPATAVEGGGTLVEGRFECRTKGGERRVAQVRWTELYDADGQFAGTLSVGMDVSSQVRAEEETRSARLHLQAVTDSMTEGLFSLGPDGGVTLMNRAAETMLGWTLDEVRGQRLHDIIHQHGLGDRNHGGLDCPLGDIARGEAGHPSEVRLVDEDVFARRDGRSLSVSYTVSPLDCVHGSDGRVVVFRDAAQVRAEQERMTEQRRALGWKERIESALARGAFRLYAQPIVDLSTRISSQNELLLRIVEEDGSVSTPQDYLVVAEENGLIGEIDRWVVGRAMDLAAAGHPVEVNVSATSICDRAFLRHVEDLLVTSGADPERLVFEITETAVMADEEAGRQFVDRVHELGCQVALDDFGTGHSGFAYLKQLPVDYVKIDIEFVRDLRRNVASQLVVEAVATLAAGMGTRTVAEGVEDDETLELLVRLGVDFAQGHHLGRPAPF